ncbi:MAG TPA: hypothetical protein VH186_15400 [Chloroflexia bacterium]|nr:hypothetical protein [Chloroflexia bacterium]
MADQKITVMVTIHGIGFQQTPAPGVEGYADGLHQHLYELIPDLLGGDTDPQHGRTSQSGPIYVHSHWPPESRDAEEGLSRLGRWRLDEKGHRVIDTSQAKPLQDGDKKIAHVALVYAHLEDQGGHIGAALETSIDALFALPRYTSLGGLITSAVTDLKAILGHHDQPNKGEPTPSLQVRQDSPTHDVVAGEKGTKQEKNPSGLLAVVKQLEQDIATYVIRNDLRERVRSFVYDALIRICSRDEVEKVIVNAHSQGTVVAYDVLRALPPFAAEKIACLVTNGSPLRKYVSLFYWGADAGCLSQVRWENLWDDKDPVADPLVPGEKWKRGAPYPEHDEFSVLYYALDASSGEFSKVRIRDTQVDNVTNSAGSGLVAHNYWDNKKDVIPLLAGVLKEAVSEAKMPEVVEL